MYEGGGYGRIVDWVGFGFDGGRRRSDGASVGWLASWCKLVGVASDRSGSLFGFGFRVLLLGLFKL